MSDLLAQGLEISLLGISLTFVALGLLILAMILLERLFRPASSVEEGTPSALVVTVDGDSEDEEVAAAIAVALAYLRDRDKSRPTLGAMLGTERGGWWRRGHSGGAGRQTSRKARWKR
jgi:Na+-transporting methylmalonyl-CoA/oxaloacetate decarboxylase gamma subunit